MNRRNFLRGLLSLPAGLAIAPLVAYSFPSRIVIPNYRLELYFREKWLADLKRQLPFTEMCKIRSLPQVSGNSIQMYTYIPQSYSNTGAT